MVSETTIDILLHLTFLSPVFTTCCSFGISYTDIREPRFMTMSKPRELTDFVHLKLTPTEFYEFEASVWVNAPKIAFTESGYKDGEVEWHSVNLAEVG